MAMHTLGCSEQTVEASQTMLIDPSAATSTAVLSSHTGAPGHANRSIVGRVSIIFDHSWIGWRAT